MKKRVLLTLTPPKLTKELREIAHETITDDKQKAAKSYRYQFCLRAKVQKGYLIISFFETKQIRCGGKYPSYVIYLDKKKNDFLTFETDSGTWRTVMLMNLPEIRESYRAVKYIPKRDEEIIKKHLGLEKGNYEALEYYQILMRQRRLDEKYRKITKKWDEILKPVRALPKDWEKWVLRKGISQHYIFYKYKRNGATEGYCTCCGRTVPINKPKYNKEDTCPKCGQKIRYKSVDKHGPICTEEETVYLMQRCKPGFILREFTVRMAIGKYSYQNPTVCCREKSRYLYDEKFHEMAFDYEDYKRRGTRWVKKASDLSGPYNRHYNPYYGYYYTWSRGGAVYPSTLPDLAKKELKMSGLPEILASGDYFWPRKYLNALKTAPVLEQLVKAGLLNLAKEVIDSPKMLAGVKKNGKLHIRLGISKNALKRLGDKNGDYKYLVWLQEESVTDKYLDDELIFWFIKHGILPKDLRFIQKHMSFVQIKNYLIRQKGKRKDDISQVLTTWSDYLSMAARIKMNVDDAIVYRTSKLYQRHKEIIRYIEENKMSVTATELADQFPNVNQILSDLRKKYEYQGETYSIIAPRSIEDILKEGEALHHCIDKKTEYLERMNEQETYILFLRKTEQPDVPYYTLEVEPGGVIRQKRTEYDRQNKDIEDACDFLKEWQKEVQKRITANDKELADRSRQLRMESYAEMRKKKVKINGGLFVGKYLADVLEADLMEMPETLEPAA